MKFGQQKVRQRLREATFLFNQFDSKQNKTIHWTNIRHVVSKLDLGQQGKIDLPTKSAEDMRAVINVDENGYVNLKDFHAFVARSMS